MQKINFTLVIFAKVVYSRWVKALRKFPQLVALALAAIAVGLIVAQEKSDQPFTPPNAAVRKAAIGDVRYLRGVEKSAFAPSKSFQQKADPEPSDWLANHNEPGQTFEQYLRTRRNLFQEPRRTIYVQPIGKFPEDSAEVLLKVGKYAATFFSAEIKVNPIITPEPGIITSRKNPGTGKTQFLTGDILALLKKDLPDDAYAMLGVTMTDLYPKESWNFVFGQATWLERVGIYSFARYGEADDPEFLRRCLRVFTHETGHMFALLHCVHFQCLMNGSNHLDESDATPLHFCPVCLRKFHSINPLAIEHRYRALGKFYQENDLKSDAQWIENRLKEIAD